MVVSAISESQDFCSEKVTEKWNNRFYLKMVDEQFEILKKEPANTLYVNALKYCDADQMLFLFEMLFGRIYGEKRLRKFKQ